MPTYLTPGVYVDEIARRPQSIGEIEMSVAGSVDDLLARSGAFVALGGDARQDMARDMVRIATALLTASDPDDDREDEPPPPLALAVDFPAFVANLISGVFGSIVDASIEQMDAYAALLAGVAAASDASGDERLSACAASDLLVRTTLLSIAARSTA